jgi:segregation and condensation protein B
LALVAYRQPITRPEIDEVRGVDTGSAVRVLLERGLIKMLGRKDEPGRPLLYGTAPYFLEFFGMNSLKDLPTLREFTELNEENRELFQQRTGGSIEDIEAELAAERGAIGATEYEDREDQEAEDDEDEDEDERAGHAAEQHSAEASADGDEADATVDV